MLPMNQKITLGATVDLLQGPLQMKISAGCLYPEMFLAMVPGGGLARNKFYGPVNCAIETKDFSKFHFELNGLGLKPDPRFKINFPKISGMLSFDKTAMSFKADGPVQIRSPGIDLGPFKFEILSQITSGKIEQFSLTIQKEIAKTWNITPKLMALPLSSADFPDQIQLVDPQFKLFVSGNLEHQTGKLNFSGAGLKSFRNYKAMHTDVLDISGLQVNTEFDGNFGRPESLKHIELDALIDKITFQQNNIELNTASLNASSDAAFSFSDSDIVLDNAKALIKSNSIHLKQEDRSADIPEFNIETVAKKGTAGKDLIINVNAVCNKAKIVSKKSYNFV